MRELFELLLLFARIGVVTFGGGYAMLPILQRELAEKRQWVSLEELADYYAIGQCTPGIIAVNVATFIGYKRRGTAGAIFATLGLILPSMVIISIIAAFLKNFADLAVVKNAFAGIRACVCVLILNTIVKLWKGAVKDKPALAIFAVIFVVSVFTSFPAAALVIAAGVTGIAIGSVRGRKEASK